MKLLCFFIITITSLFLKFHHVTALNFTFPSLYQNPDKFIYFYDDADTGQISLTKARKGNNMNHSVGRIGYSEPLYLWDKDSEILTNFSTNFTFSINSFNISPYADGMAFFLTPTSRGGESLGLPFNPFVAIEFDTFYNGDVPDPKYVNSTSDHVGININSMLSRITEKWESGVMDGRTNAASISYDSSSKILTVTFTNFVPNSTIPFMKSLSYSVDLRDYLPEYVLIGLSAATGPYYETHTLKSWSFYSSLKQPNHSKPPKTSIEELLKNSSTEPPKSSSPDPPKSSTKSVGLMVGLSIGGFLLLIGIVCIFMWEKKRRARNFDGDRVDGQLDEFDMCMDDDFERGIGPTKFSNNDLIHATNNFSENEKLGEGGFGAVYRGYLKDSNSYVAVKRVSRGSKQGMKEYASEVKIISRLRHRNLVQLMGWCHERNELLLVYEFMPNGSLDSHLFKEVSVLSWDLRCQIALGLASALLYLHEEWDQCVLHRDIKSSNIMLDSNFNTKLGDFGLARLVDHGKVSQTTVVAGTIGYMAPEYIVTQKASKESDVYSFGVVAMEIACGRKCVERDASEDQVNIIEWVWEVYGDGNIIKAADPRLANEFDDEQMKCLMMVGLCCVHPDPKSRPSIRQAIQILNFELPMPTLPLKMPVPMYSPPSVPLSLVFSSLGITGSSQNQS